MGINNIKTYEEKLVSENIKVGIVAARFNEFITSRLLAGAIDGLRRENVKENDIETVSYTHLLTRRKNDKIPLGLLYFTKYTSA